MFKKLALKIGFLFFIFIVIIEFLGYFFLYINLANNRFSEAADELLIRGNRHRAYLEEYHFDEHAMEHVAIMESETDYSVVITDASGLVIVHSDPVDEEMRAFMRHTHSDSISQTEGKIIEENWRERNYIATDSPITIDGEHFGHVYMFEKTDDIEKIIAHLNDQLFICGLITILLTIIIIFILSRRVVKPLIEMTTAAGELSKGKHNVQLHTNRMDELGELAKSFTTLSNDLEHMKRNRYEFLSSISHELRTPLTYIKGYADILSRDNITDKEKDGYIEIIQYETEQLEFLIRNLFEMAMINQNRFIIDKKIVRYERLIYTVTEHLRPAFEEKNIIFSVNFPEKVIATLDPERIQQVLVNLLDNAKKHTPSGKRILLDVFYNSNEIITVISDEGEGIPKEELPHIFELFYRVEKSKSRISGGTGLGLAIAKEIVETHGGSIEVESKVSVGTTFVIKFPRGEVIE